MFRAYTTPRKPRQPQIDEETQSEQERIAEMEEYDRRNPDTYGAITRHESRFPF